MRKQGRRFNFFPSKSQRKAHKSNSEQSAGSVVKSITSHLLFVKILMNWFTEILEILQTKWQTKKHWAE